MILILKLSKLMKFLTDGSNIRNEWHLKIKISDEIIRLYRTFLLPILIFIIIFFY